MLIALILKFEYDGQVISISSALELVSSLICFAGSDSTSDSSCSRFPPLGGIKVGGGLGSYSREAIV